MKLTDVLDALWLCTEITIIDIDTDKELYKGKIHENILGSRKFNYIVYSIIPVDFNKAIISVYRKVGVENEIN